MALCALLHSFVPEKIPYENLNPEDSLVNFEIAFRVADSLSIPGTLVSNLRLFYTIYR
jgi:hypothetical protein